MDMFQSFNQLKQKLLPCYLVTLFHEKAFTLIELVIVIGVIAISLPIVFGLFFLILQAQSRIYILQEVKRNGDYTLSVMQNIIKDRAYAIYSDPGLANENEVCSTKSSPSTPTSAANPLYFKDPDGRLFYFYADETTHRIASYSAITNPNTYWLTNEKVAIEPDNFSLSCFRTSIFSPPIVAVSFSISQAGSPARHEEKASLNYQTKVKLKSY
jgi:type II secretory pathway pseudopilin PulG